MEVVKAADKWAKGEIASAIAFILYGLSFLLVGLGFCLYGEAALHKALSLPMALAGGLLLGAGLSFYLSNKARLKNFESEYRANPSAVIKAELERTEKTIGTYKNVALKVFPAFVLVAILLLVFVSKPLVKAISIGVIAFFAVLILQDSQALRRMKTYHQQLELIERELKS